MSSLRIEIRVALEAAVRSAIFRISRHCSFKEKAELAADPPVLPVWLDDDRRNYLCRDVSVLFGREDAPAGNPPPVSEEPKRKRSEMSQRFEYFCWL